MGEVREPEPARVLLGAWNTGHSGGLATIHANDALSGLRKLETLIGGHEPSVRERIASAIKNYVFFSLQCDGKLKGDFETLFLRLWKRYLEKTGGQEILRVIAPFFAFRPRVMASPV